MQTLRTLRTLSTYVIFLCAFLFIAIGFYEIAVGDETRGLLLFIAGIVMLMDGTLTRVKRDVEGLVQVHQLLRDSATEAMERMGAQPEAEVHEGMIALDEDCMDGFRKAVTDADRGNKRYVEFTDRDDTAHRLPIHAAKRLLEAVERAVDPGDISPEPKTTGSSGSQIH